MRLPNLTGEFRLASDPELRFTQAGKAVTGLTVIATESRKNQQTQEWEDGDSTPWISVSLWDKAAEAAAEELTKGQRVLVSGALFVREYDRNDGTKGQSVELKYATVAAVPGGKPRAERSQGWDAGKASGGQQRQAPASDPWATPANNDAPPF